MSFDTDFAKFNERSKAHGPWLQIRQNGKKYFKKNGWPSRQQEDWKYTSVKEIAEAAYIPTALQDKSSQGVSSDLKALLPKDFYNLVFVNGEFSEKLSDLKGLSDSIEVRKLGDFTAGKAKSDFLKEFKSLRHKVGGASQDSFEALNAAYTSSGLFIRIKKEKSLKKPIHILHFSSGKKAANYFRNYIVCEERSQLSLVESYAGPQASQYFNNSVLEVNLKSSSKLEYVRFQDESWSSYNYGRARFFLANQATLESMVCSTGAKLARHNLDVYLMGPEAFAQVNGLYLVTESQHIDNHTNIDHVVGKCTSRQHYKGILDQKSRAVFDGKVLIRQDSQQASSDQLNNNLLLSSSAEADSKPQLQIYADDVKATHGSTVGQLNSEELFYFLSRAISKEKAIEMLSLGYVSELLFQVGNEKTRAWLQEKLLLAYRRWKEL